MTDANDNAEMTDLRSQVEKVVEMMRPAIQSDGGDIEVRFGVVCIGFDALSWEYQS